ncbi:alanine racemase [Woeseia oceani]|uniref:Alanine racemase n=1 Tax=Woeseia oceani TaxID=1548547 RepID=A0A193LGM1_9GAMM|nr:alanine racemase [Woeseia oceani]ANO51611.1 alanine racemase [Woeseia oceani]
MTQGARAHISPSALSHNLKLVQTMAPAARVLAAIKGNAYGHGLLTAAKALAAADGLAIARLSEAETLRSAGIDQRLVLLAGPSSQSERALAAACQCEIVVHSHAQLSLLDGRGSGATFVVWLKVDTGMHRLGFQPEEVAAVLARLRASPQVADIRLMTHFACADDPSDPLTTAQQARFQRVCKGFDGDVSAANSPALFSITASVADSRHWGNLGATWVRPGLSLYGISPFASGSGADLGLRPAMTFETQLIDVRGLPAGQRVGYGGRWSAPRDTVIGVIAAGYADGYTRFLPSATPVLINGRRVPLAGTVSMDMAVVDLGAGATDKVGDRVTLWGPELPVEEVARAAATIPYQLVTGVMHREPPLIGE